MTPSNRDQRPACRARSALLTARAKSSFIARRGRAPIALVLLGAAAACSTGDPPATSNAAAGLGGVGAEAGIINGAIGGTGGAIAVSGAPNAAPGSAQSGDAAGSANAGRGPASSTAGTTGSGDTGGTAGAAGTPTDAGGESGSDCARSAEGCGAVLYVAGVMPRVGVDLQLHQVLAKLNLQVEDVRETALPAQAAGKRLVVFSYSMSSAEFKAEDWANLPVPIVVLEHYLLPRLSMTTAQGHGFEEPVTDLEITGDDPLFAAGLAKGKVTVYAQTGEFFWGVPAAGALTIATVLGKPAEPVTFGYLPGSQMVGRIAPAKRVQVFAAVHAPPPNPAPFLTESGLKLFGGAVSWAIH